MVLAAPVVYVNNGITLFADPAQAVREFARVLAPEGLLILEAVIRETGEGAENTSIANDIEAARAAGGSTGAAHTYDDTVAWFNAAGFEEPAAMESFPVTASGDQLQEGAASSSFVCVFHSKMPNHR